MSPNLSHEIKQTRPFASKEVEAYLNLIRTAALFEQELVELLKPHKITPSQYNVLRILRGAGDNGLCRYEVIDRLVAPGPDVTRLLDRLEKVGLIVRRRDDENRRLVKASITAHGAKLLEDLDQPTHDLHALQFQHLGMDRVQALIDLLTKARLHPTPN